jgi:hypothetical protein
MPGHLTSLSGEMVHPRGRIEADLHFENSRVYGKISLPVDLTGTFRYFGKTLGLTPSLQSIEL